MLFDRIFHIKLHGYPMPHFTILHDKRVVRYSLLELITFIMISFPFLSLQAA